jgi:prevent-host-death family protein
MKTFTYSQARQRLSEVLDTALKEDVVITRRGGDCFTVTRHAELKSPFDVPALTTNASTTDILKAVRESRRRKR